VTRDIKPDSETSGGAANAPPISREEALAAFKASGYELAKHPAHMIRRAHQRATFYFQQVMAGHDLTPTQHAAIATLLKHGELSQNHLGRLTAMDPSTISIVVRKLLKDGLIERRGSKKDQRLAIIKLTDKGTRYSIDRLADSLEVARRVLAPLSAEERETLMALLHKIGDGDDDFA
jgi:MarR family transcriptional regulator, lower aerobic nicotinate degradation pathway regulator